MGDAYKDVITDEERAIQMGESAAPEETVPATETAEQTVAEPEPETAPEGEAAPEGEVETEQGEEAPAEDAPAENKDPIQKRFDRLTWEKHETERKLDLFKRLGPEGYYTAYPDERPEAAPAPEQRREAIPLNTDIGSLIVKQPNGPYDSMTLREVYEVDPVFATNLQTDFRMQQKEEAQRRKAEAEGVRSEAATEIETFADSVAQEVFGKPAKGLAKDEEAKIAGTIQEVLDWMRQTHRGGGNISDAYFLMNKEGLLKGAASKAAAATLKSLQERRGPASINTNGGGDVKETGYEAVEKMTEQKLADYIDGMNDKAVTKFLTDAPKGIRAKFPNMPWKQKK